jgi:hypothetical protein
MLVASMRLDPYCSGNHRFVGVGDTSALLSCVGNDCRKGAYWQSDLLRMANRGAATLWEPNNPVTYATWTYSWIRPPSRSL